MHRNDTALSCDQRVIGKAYSVLARRRGKIIKEEVPEGQTSFVVFGFLPTAEAPGISQEIRQELIKHQLSAFQNTNHKRCLARLKTAYTFTAAKIVNLE